MKTQLLEDENLTNVNRMTQFAFAAPTARQVSLASGELPTEELDATLVKPFSSGQLLETVREVLLAADNAGGRTAVFFPVPTEDARQITPASQWGINE